MTQREAGDHETNSRGPSRPFLERRTSAWFPGVRTVVPKLDDAFRLTLNGCSQIDLNEPRRLKQEKIARLDWHNDLSKLLLDVTDAVDAAADDRGRAVIIRRMRRALEDDGA